MLDPVNHPNRRVFAFEFTTHKPGIRKFTVGDLDEFCDCKFYNKNVNEPDLINQLIYVVGDLLENMIGEPVPKSCFLALESSTDDKFSCHLIVHLPNNKLFPSTVRMKTTIDRIVKACEDANVGIIDSGNPLAPEKCFVDNTIYTRNRNFRMFLSTKCGQETPLKLADYCTFYANRSEPPSDKQIFFDSLIIPKDYQNYGILDMHGH
uniref:DNA-directed primase/polymerase protein n=1 Tax=Ditylenchus dipsaci TaxID=166011 RepID=A0A915D2D7_9BILA